MCPYKHLSINERESLLILIKSNKSITEISKAMGRSKSKISRELKRNSGVRDIFPACRRRKDITNAARLVNVADCLKMKA